MLRFLLPILTLLASFSANAQDYQIIRSNDVNLYSNDFGFTRGVRIDSVSIENGDSIFYPSRTVLKESQNQFCYFPYGTSWISDRIVIKPNGINLLFNKSDETLESDTILIKTLANPGELWDAYSDLNGMVITAAVVSADLLDVFGQLDSVKTIEFQAYQSGEPVPNPANGKQLMLSKSHGMLQTLNFQIFPSAFDPYYDSILLEFELVGKQNEGLGIQNLTWFEVFDFEIGDILHIEQLSQMFGMGSKLEIEKKYIGRQDNPTNIIYEVERTTAYYSIEASAPSFDSLTVDTIYETVEAAAFFDELSLLPTAFEGFVEGLYYLNQLVSSDISGLTIRKKEAYFSDILTLQDPEIECWQPIIDGACVSDDRTSYYEGLGGPYSTCSNSVFDFSNTELVFYQKGDTIWGTPFDFTVGIAENQTENPIKIYPNPASDFLIIDAASTFDRIDFYNSSGKKVRSLKTSSIKMLGSLFAQRK